MHENCYISEISSKGWWTGKRWIKLTKGKPYRLTIGKLASTDNRETQSTDNRETLND